MGCETSKKNTGEPKQSPSKFSKRKDSIQVTLKRRGSRSRKKKSIDKSIKRTLSIE
jgi:hypothetical protein